MNEYVETMSKLTGRTLDEVVGTINYLIIEGKTTKEVKKELLNTLQIATTKGY